LYRLSFGGTISSERVAPGAFSRPLRSLRSFRGRLMRVPVQCPSRHNLFIKAIREKAAKKEKKW